MKGDTVKEKKRLYWLLPVVILLLAAVGWFFWKYTFVDGTVTARSADTIDLRGREISEEKLRTIESRFPDAHVLWDVTVGGKSFDGESESIVTADFTTEDIPSFARLKNLKEADVNIACFFKANITIFTFPSFREAVCLSIPDIQEQISVSRINPVSPYINRLFPGDLTVKEQQKKSPASEKETGDRKTATTYSPTCAVPSA